MLSLSDLYEPFGQADVYCAGIPVGSTDKGTTHSYIKVYEDLFAPYRHQTNLRILEIGIERGASLLLWSEYFSDCRITGIDLSDNLILPEVQKTSNIQIILTDATKKESLSVLDNEYDLIIDDGSHQIEDQLASFYLLFPLLRSGGLYIIEDIGTEEGMKRIAHEAGAEIIDLRQIKGRFDDVLAVIRKE